MRLPSLILFSVLVAACASSEGSRRRVVPRNALRAGYLGCYELLTQTGTRVDSTFYNASPLVRLDSSGIHSTITDTLPGILRSLVRLDTGGRALDPAILQLQSFHWAADSLTDSIWLSFFDGLSGTVVILAAPALVTDTLWGRLMERWDVGPSVFDRGSVHAIRVRCVVNGPSDR